MATVGGGSKNTGELLCKQMGCGHSKIKHNPYVVDHPCTVVHDDGHGAEPSCACPGFLDPLTSAHEQELKRLRAQSEVYEKRFRNMANDLTNKDVLISSLRQDIARLEAEVTAFREGYAAYGDLVQLLYAADCLGSGREVLKVAQIGITAQLNQALMGPVKPDVPF